MSINRLLRPSSTERTVNESTGIVTFRDYKHASRIFVDSDFRLSPKYGFLFYVEFDFNPFITNVSNNSAREMGMIVKRVDLPKFNLDTKIHNAYNRVNVIQNKIKYDQISITFHDDQADNIRNFWYDYYSFYYRDSDYADATYSAITKYQSRPSFDWGYSPRPTIGYNNYNGNQEYQYINNIRIYSLYQKNFDEYQLVNPIITSFRHGEHANGDNTSLLQHEMTVQFETVKYLTGYTTADTVGGYIDLHYDSTPSPISPINGTNIIDSNGMGDAGKTNSVITDLAQINAGAFGTPRGLDQALQVANSAGGFVSVLDAVTGATASQGNNGLSIPAFGPLLSRTPSGASLQAQLQASAVQVAGSAANRLANGVVSGFATGLGANGKTIIGLTAAALSNPSGLVKTVENMAITYAMNKASAWVNTQIETVIAPAVSGYAREAGQWVDKTLITPVLKESLAIWNTAKVDWEILTNPGANGGFQLLTSDGQLFKDQAGNYVGQFANGDYGLVNAATGVLSLADNSKNFVDLTGTSITNAASVPVTVTYGIDAVTVTNADITFVP